MEKGDNSYFQKENSSMVVNNIFNFTFDYFNCAIDGSDQSE